MDFSHFDLTPEQQAFAKEVTTFLDANLTQEVYDRVRPLEANFDEEFVLALGRKGWITPRWSKEDGGADLDTVSAKGYAFQIEMTYRAIEAGATVREVPIVFRDRQAGVSKMSGVIVLEAVWQVPKLRFRGVR